MVVRIVSGKRACGAPRSEVLAFATTLAAAESLAAHFPKREAKVVPFCALDAANGLEALFASVPMPKAVRP